VRAEVLAKLLEARRQKRPAALLRWLQGGADGLVVNGRLESGDRVDEAVLRAVASAHREGRGRTIATAHGPLFIQVFNPPLRLIVVGAVHITQSLAPMARLAGYDVTVVDPRRAFASDARFPDVAVSVEWPDDALGELEPDARTAVVTLTHDPKLDDPALDRALRSDAFYVAALGSRRTHAGRVERLKAMGHDEKAIARIHGPAGLSIGAVSPAEIALSVMAEMTRTLRQEHGA
jgi:xanthine dehydrogenase accessory factor